MKYTPSGVRWSPSTDFLDAGFADRDVVVGHQLEAAWRCFRTGTAASARRRPRWHACCAATAPGTARGWCLAAGARAAPSGAAATPRAGRPACWRRALAGRVGHVAQACAPGGSARPAGRRRPAGPAGSWGGRRTRRSALASASRPLAWPIEPVDLDQPGFGLAVAGALARGRPCGTFAFCGGSAAAGGFLLAAFWRGCRLAAAACTAPRQASRRSAAARCMTSGQEQKSVEATCGGTCAGGRRRAISRRSIP